MLNGTICRTIKTLIVYLGNGYKKTKKKL